MPNYDGGKYFLSVFAPVKLGSSYDGKGPPHSYLHTLKEQLQALPTAEQTRASIASGEISPFSRCKRTHFARFSVIDDVVFNGRMPSDAIVTALKGENPSLPQHVDQLGNAFLYFGADFDGTDEGDNGLASYLTELWRVMEPELRAVFDNCVGFETVRDAAGFVAYIKRCQVETTMPFNDYWTVPPPLGTLDLGGQKTAGVIAAIAMALPLLAGLLYLLAALLDTFHFLPDFAAFLLKVGEPSVASALTLVFLGGLLLLAAAAWSAYSAVIAHGQKPFPTAPDSDLRSILKGLYLRQSLIPFIIDSQGLDPAALHARFGEFVARTRPDSIDGPTQSPGVIRLSPRNIVQ